jgi:hypothetical protein
MSARHIASKLEKVYRFPDGTMTERQWVERYADRLGYKATRDPYDSKSTFDWAAKTLGLPVS